MNYEIEVRDIEPARVAYMRFTGSALDASKAFPKVFQSVRGKNNGAPFVSYLSMNASTQIGEMELCVPTSATPTTNGVEVKELPRIKAVCITHTGPYETLGNAYAAIDAYAAENGLTLVRPFREVYIKGPGMLVKGNPEKYVTEILFPIQEG